MIGAGVIVTTVCPGLMRTGSPRNATFKGNHRAEYAALFPRPIAGLLGLVSRLLPGPGENGSRGVRAANSESALSPSLLTVLGDRAAARNNEIGPG